MTATTASRRKTTKAKQEEAEHSLSHLLPAPTVRDEYIPRKIGGVWDTHLLKYARARGYHTALVGPTGPGKTTLVRAYASKERLPLVTVVGQADVDPSTFWGQFTADPETGHYRGWVDSDILTGVREGNCIIYLDEMNAFTGDITSMLHPMLDARRQVTVLELGNKKFDCGPNLQIITSFNVGSGYEGTRRVNRALWNRFAVKVPFGYDRDVESALVPVQPLLDVAAELRRSFDQGELETPISTNMLQEFVQISLDVNLQFAVENFIAAFEDHEQPVVRERLSLENQEAMLKAIQDIPVDTE